MGGDAGKKKGSSGGGSGGGNNGFKALGLSESIYHGIVRMGFRMPTPVQRKALPVVLTGSDACVMARTGSGKTIAFLVPLLEKLLKSNATINSSAIKQSSCRAVILSPTRELSLQTLKVLIKLAHFTEVRSIGIHGGEGMEKQFDMLASKPDIIVATPGRLAHHLSEIPDFNLSNCMMCILDEGDRCMEMGFSQQIREIGRTMPEHCQKVILSATMPKVLVEFTKSGFCVDPHVVRLDNECSVSEELRLAFLTTRSAEKDAALLHVLSQIKLDLEANESLRTGLTIIFAATRHHVEYIHSLLQALGISSTLIYGTLDQDARKSNLSAFRSGKKSVLVVTDVAARGIDVPLIDHVIHYHFPPDAKLFVHRSGRAARAGRIGFCWGLVDPEEMPYMIDLHLILGRRATNSSDDGAALSYTLNEMTPEMVHYGSLPVSILTQEVENVQRLINSEMAGSLHSESLQALARVCNNAMKQYRRTRPEASRDAVRRSKAIMEGTRLESGQRIGKGRIPTHPLLRGIEETAYLAHAGKKGGDDKLHNLKNFKDCENLLEEIAAYRPKETVFEAFATGVARDTGVASQIDRGRTTSAKKNNASVALTAMKSMRRQMRTVRNKGAALVVAGSSTANEMNDGVEEDDAETPGADQNVTAGAVKSDVRNAGEVDGDKEANKTPIIRRPKTFLSKAERRRQAKAKKSGVQRSDTQTDAVDNKTATKKQKSGSDFRDPAFYIENDFTSNTEEARRARKMEAAMQPSAGTTKGIVGQAFRIEEAMLDVVGDENEELVQKQRMMRWDKSKRKYIQTTVGEELRGDSKTKKMRLESGKLVSRNEMKLGELYTKWQKKTNRSIGRTGVFDDAPDTGAGDDIVSSGQKKFRNNKGVKGGDSSKGKGKKGGDSGKGKKGGGDSSEGSRSALDIKKGRDKKQDQKMKNMKKGDRKRVEQTKKQGDRKGGAEPGHKSRAKKGR